MAGTHKMDTLLVCDVVVTLNTGDKRRLGMIVNFNPKIKPKGCGSSMLDFKITDYISDDKFKDKLDTIYDKVLGKGFTLWLTAKINAILHVSQYKDNFTEISLLNIKEINTFNESIIADFPVEEIEKEENSAEKGE